MKIMNQDLRKRKLWNLMPIVVLAVAGGLLLAGPGGPGAAFAQGDESDVQTPRTVTLAAMPAAPPQFALQYRLLPTRAEKKPGNAAPFYYRALLLRAQVSKEAEQAYADNYERWMEWPLDEKTRQEMRDWTANYSNALDELRVAVYREECDWGYRMQDLEGMDIVSFRLQEIQDSRGLARVLTIKARVEMAEGRWQDALETLRAGFQLASDVAQPPTLINALVGVAIAQTMLADLQLMVNDPNAPNLYWALTALPQPLINMRPSLDQEMNFTMQLLPMLQNVDTVERSDEEWNRQLLLCINALEQFKDIVPFNVQGTVQQTGLAAIVYPAAKRELIAAGLPNEEVEAMPVGKVVLMQTARATRYSVEEVFKWSYFPYAEAQSEIERTEKRLIEQGYMGSGIWKVGTLPVAALLLPAVNSAMYAPLRLERNLAMARTVEAVRLHAAAHHGKWPDSLKDIRDVPVPRDPLNNEPFTYRVEDGAVILEMPPRAGFTPSSDGLRIILKR
jgi:hypothetical protein